MADPRYTKQQIWKKLCQFIGCRISSLTGRRSHLLVSADQTTKRYTIEYESGNTKHISLDELYALYVELYHAGILSYGHMRKHAKRILGWSQWHAPGSAMMALLPVLDDCINISSGTLSVE